LNFEDLRSWAILKKQTPDKLVIANLCQDQVWIPKLRGHPLYFDYRNQSIHQSGIFNPPLSKTYASLEIYAVEQI